MQDTGQYTCMVTNSAGNTTASAVLNVSASDPSNTYSYFTTVTVETLEPRTDEEESARQYINETFIDFPNPTVHQPGVTITPSLSSLSSLSPRINRAPENTVTEPPEHVTNIPGLDDVMKTTKIIIGCFVAITFMAAVMLVVFYKLRKQHQLHKHHGPARAIEIVNVEDEIGAGAGSGISGGSTMNSGTGGEGTLRIHHPEIVNLPNIGRTDTLNHYYKTHHFNNNVMGLSIGTEGMGPGGILSNKSQQGQDIPISCTSVPISTSNLLTSSGNGTNTIPSSMSPPLPMSLPMPTMGLHGSIKGFMGQSQNPQMEPLLFKGSSKENVQETQI